MKNLALALIAAIMLSVFLSCATGGGGRGGEALQDAIERSAETIAADLAPGTRVALVAFDSESDVLSDFIMEQLTRELFRRGMEVAERRNLEFVFSEMRFQMTGYVSDDTAMSVGHFLGADVVITGRLWDMGGTRRLATDAIRVETAARAGAASVEIPSNRALRNTIAALEGGAERAAFDPGTATPRTAGEFQDRGIMFLYRGENEIAAMDFSEALRINPNFASAYLGRGRARLELGEHELAIADFTEALRLSPNFAMAHVWRGIVHLTDGELDLAFVDAVNAIRLDHNSGYGFFLRGTVHFGRGDFGPALADLTEAIRLYPHEEHAHRTRGYIHREMGDLDRAVADFSEAIRVNPYLMGVRGARADIHILRGNFALAAADITEMIRIAHETDMAILNSVIAEMYFLRGETYINMEALARAAADFARAIQLDPQHIGAYFYRGRILFEWGQYFQAAEYFYAVLWLDPYHEYAYGWLDYALYRDERAAAQALEDERRRQEAVAAAEEARRQQEAAEVRLRQEAAVAAADARRRQEAEAVEARRRQETEAAEARRREEVAEADRRRQQEERAIARRTRARQNATRNVVELFAGSFVWEESEHSRQGSSVSLILLPNVYFSPVPFTSIGIEFRYTEFEVRGDSRNERRLAEGIISIAPSLGIVLPLGSAVRLFGNTLLEVGFEHKVSPSPGKQRKR